MPTLGPQAQARTGTATPRLPPRAGLRGPPSPTRACAPATAFSPPQAVSRAGFGDVPGARVPSASRSSSEAWASCPRVKSELGPPAPDGWRKLRAGGAGGDRGWVPTARPGRALFPSRQRPCFAILRSCCCDVLRKPNASYGHKGPRSVWRGFLEGSPGKRGRGSKVTCESVCR